MLSDLGHAGLTLYVTVVPTFPTPALGDNKARLPWRCPLVGRDEVSLQGETSPRLPAEGPQHTRLQTKTQRTGLLLIMSACLSLLKTTGMI